MCVVRPLADQRIVSSGKVLRQASVVVRVRAGRVCGNEKGETLEVARRDDTMWERDVEMRMWAVNGVDECRFVVLSRSNGTTAIIPDEDSDHGNFWYRPSRALDHVLGPSSFLPASR